MARECRCSFPSQAFGADLTSRHPGRLGALLIGWLLQEGSYCAAIGMPLAQSLYT